MEDQIIQDIEKTDKTFSEYHDDLIDLDPIPLTHVPVQVRDEVQDDQDGTIDADTHTDVEIDDDIHEQSPVLEVSLDAPLRRSTRDRQPFTWYSIDNYWNDPKVHIVIEKFLDVINTPPEAVQRAVSTCLSPLMQYMQNEAPTLVSKLLDQLTKSDKYGERRGTAFGLAGVVKEFGISCLKKIFEKRREGALLAFECLCENLGILFKPYVIQMLPLLLVSFSDRVIAVREAAVCAAHAMMSQLSPQGVKLVLPSLLEMLTDNHPEVRLVGQTALLQVESLIKNPKIARTISNPFLIPDLLSEGRERLQM
ncbi:hypothetical protein Q3G72_016414 [Acer saccharum]|nr:hypothetical protein Q3G72_016414 [Acer saccharum]